MIEIAHLDKSFGETRVLKDVSFHLDRGKVLGLIGASGAGKSTLLRCINGLEPYNSGSLVVDGVDVATLSEKELRDFRQNIGMIFQNYSLLERKTVQQNIDFSLKCHNVEKEERQRRIQSLLELVKLSDKAKLRPRELSGGQKQRVAIARALCTDPKILLCDEATSALDPNIALSILHLLKRLNREMGITIIVVTHQMEVVKEICDEAVVLEGGSVVYQGNVEELFLNHPKALESVSGDRNPYSPSKGTIAYTIVQRPGSERLLSDLAIASGIRFDLQWGGLDSYQGSKAGSFIVSVDESDAERFEKVLESCENFNNCEKIEWRRWEGQEGGSNGIDD